MDRIYQHMDRKVQLDRDEMDTRVERERNQMDIKVQQEREFVDRMIKDDREDIRLRLEQKRAEVDKRLKRERTLFDKNIQLEREEMDLQLKMLEEDMDYKLREERNIFDRVVQLERAKMDRMSMQARADMDMKIQQERKVADYEAMMERARIERKIMQEGAIIDTKAPIMEFHVFKDQQFSDIPKGYVNVKPGIMTFTERGKVEWSKMLLNLYDQGYKRSSDLYYIKPGSVPPQGMVLISGEEDVHQMMQDHEGREICDLYIVMNYSSSDDTDDGTGQGDSWEYGDWGESGSDDPSPRTKKPALNNSKKALTFGSGDGRTNA